MIWIAVLICDNLLKQVWPVVCKKIVLINLNFSIAKHFILFTTDLTYDYRRNREQLETHTNKYSEYEVFEFYCLAEEKKMQSMVALTQTYEYS